MNSLLALLPWRRLLKVGKPFWTSEKRGVAFAHLVAIMSLLALNAAVAVFVNQTAGHFMTAVETRSLPDFYFYLFCAVAAILVAAPIGVLYSFFRTRLALVWRNWLSESLIDTYLKDDVFHAVNSNPHIDNPEQRLTQDVESFCNSTVGLFIAIVDASVNVLTFVTVLWVISPSLSFMVMVYSTLGLLIVSTIGKSLVGHNYKLIKNEGDLRAPLTQARTQLVDDLPLPESLISLAKVNLGNVIGTLMDILKVTAKIQAFTGVFNPLVGLIPVVIIAPSYFASEIPFGTITQAVLAFCTVFNGATVLIAQFSGISSFAAITNRLGALIEVMEDSMGALSRVNAH